MTINIHDNGYFESKMADISSTGHFAKSKCRRDFVIPQIGGSSINRIVSTEMHKWWTAHHHTNLPAYENVSVSCQMSLNSQAEKWPNAKYMNNPKCIMLSALYNMRYMEQFFSSRSKIRVGRLEFFSLNFSSGVCTYKTTDQDNRTTEQGKQWSSNIRCSQ